MGDHIPAYLINAWLATGEPAYADMLAYCADVIEARFPDDEHSPFVQERFHADWSHDLTWGWQQNRAVVGHNLKIAWNLMRIQSIRPNDRYEALAEKIGRVMPAHGSDQQRGGWYDVVDRVLQPGQEVHRYTWHDRKAWWQQEQAILAYLILAGTTGDEEWLRLARESEAFYNAWFLDYDYGSVYFNVLANGIPYLLGTERLKGSHSMAGYHSFELAYLAAVYFKLLVAKEPMDLYFSPLPGASARRHPAGGAGHPAGGQHQDRRGHHRRRALQRLRRRGAHRARARGQASGGRSASRSSPRATPSRSMSISTRAGSWSCASRASWMPAPSASSRRRWTRSWQTKPSQLVLQLADLESISSVGIRVLLFARQKMEVADRADIYAVAPRPAVREALTRVDPNQDDINVVESFDPFRDSDRLGKRPD